MLKITLHYKHCAGGSCRLLRNRPVSITYGCMRNHKRIGGNAVRDASTCLFPSSFSSVADMLALSDNTHGKTGVWEVHGATRVCASAERDLLILQGPNQKYYSFTRLIIQTELGIISLHVIYLSSKTPEEKITESHIRIYLNLWRFKQLMSNVP